MINKVNLGVNLEGATQLNKGNVADSERTSLRMFRVNIESAVEKRVEGKVFTLGRQSIIVELPSRARLLEY